MKTKMNLFLALITGLIVSFTVQAGDNLDSILDAQSDEAKARFEFRNPKATLEFFGIEPGMTVAEALPGGGWYSKILLPYLGEEGKLIGIDYAMEMWPHFGGFATEEFIEGRKSWPQTWPEKAAEWGGESSAAIAAGTFAAAPEGSAESTDAVLFIRALHNLARFEDKGGYMTQALKAAYDMLKPGGVVGVVQHEAREDRPDEWANGSNGYVKRSAVISAMEAAGFEFVGASDVNQNEKDQASEGDVVWRLPPSLRGAKEDEELKAKMMAIGESNRMTLKFKKPS